MRWSAKTRSMTMGGSRHVQSESRAAEHWNRFGDAGRALLVGGAVLAPLWRKQYRTSLNGLAAILAVSAASKAIKAFWREPRPNGQNNNSFPSQHAGDCFAAAAVLKHEWNEGVGPFAFGLATAVSLSRVFSGKHHPADVIAGGAFGVIAGDYSS